MSSSPTRLERLDWSRFASAKRSFTTRRVRPEELEEQEPLHLLRGRVRPRPGDLVLAQVTALGKHRHLELPTGRRAQMHVGDTILVAYAARYAPDQFESEVPHNLGPTELVAGGGVASSVLSRHSGVSRATKILPIGLLANSAGEPYNLNQFGLPAQDPPETRPSVTAVFGTSMNAGKTTIVRQLARGLHLGGHRPAAAKVTGTGSGGDLWSVYDAGAEVVLDFTDAGFASTYQIEFASLDGVVVRLIDALANRSYSHIIIEVADGLLQRETRYLATSEIFRKCVDRVMFAADGALSAVAGVAELRSLGHNVVGVSGSLTRSPLATREAESMLDVPVVTRNELAAPELALSLVEGGAQSNAILSDLRAEALDLRDGVSEADRGVDPRVQRLQGQA